MPIVIVNATQFTGIAALAVAAIACFLARRQALWTTLGFINAVLAIDIATGMRYRLGNLARDWLWKEDMYLDRRPIQVLLLLVAFVFGVIAARGLLRRRKPWVRAALIGTLGAVAINGLELISLHQIDDILYTKLPGILLIGWLWLMSGSLTTVAAVKARK